MVFFIKMYKCPTGKKKNYGHVSNTVIICLGITIAIRENDVKTIILLFLFLFGTVSNKVKFCNDSISKVSKYNMSKV